MWTIYFFNKHFILHVVDIDECTEGSHNCNAANAACINNDGSFTCGCNTGYSGDGVNSCTGRK